MKRFVKYPLEGGGSITVETEEPEPPGGMVKVGRQDEAMGEAKQTLESTLGSLQPISSALVEKLHGAANPPNEITVEFGISLSSTMGIIITKAGVDANFTVTLNWKRDQ